MKMGRKKGYKLSDEAKRKIGLANSISLKGKIRPESARKNISIGRKGIIFSEKTKNKMSDSKKGEKNHRWKGGITPVHYKIRNSKEYYLWRTAVFERDNYTCIWCGDNKGGNLQADHIKPFAIFPEFRFAIDNGRTLCISCHKKTDTYGVKNSTK